MSVIESSIIAVFIMILVISVLGILCVLLMGFSYAINRLEVAMSKSHNKE